MCGVKNRIIGHSNNIFSYKDKECCSNLLGFKTGNVSDTLDKIIEINRDDLKQVIPEKVSISKIGDMNWRNIHETSLEFYLDYETMNSNLGQILVEDDNIGYQNNQFIFQIGVGYSKNNKWVYKSFVAPTNDLIGEIKMINSFWQYIESVKKSEKKNDCHFVHWYSAEPISYKKLQKRVSSVGSKVPDKDFLDLYSLFRKEPITVNGSLNFSLKSVAKAMNKHKLIRTNWKLKPSLTNLFSYSFYQ